MGESLAKSHLVERTGDENLSGSVGAEHARAGPPRAPGRAAGARCRSCPPTPSCSSPAPAATARTTRWSRWRPGWRPLPVHRRDFPYRQAGRKAPGRAPELVAPGVEEAGRLKHPVRAFAPGRLVLGGPSMGGRMCSMADGGGMSGCRGPVLLELPTAPGGQARTPPHRPLRWARRAVSVRLGDPGPVRDPRTSSRRAVGRDARARSPLECLDGQRHDPSGGRRGRGLDARVAAWLDEAGLKGRSPGAGGAGGCGPRRGIRSALDGRPACRAGGAWPAW